MIPGECEFQIPDNVPMAIEKLSTLTTCSGMGEIVLLIEGRIWQLPIAYLVAINPHALRAGVYSAETMRWAMRNRLIEGFQPVNYELVPGNVIDLAVSRAVDELVREDLRRNQRRR